MTANHAWMLKGWLLAEHAPVPIMDAVESVIASLARNVPTETVSGTQPFVAIPPEKLAFLLEISQPTANHQVSSSPLAEQDAPAELALAVSKKPRRQNTMSPENRAAASERMRAMQAAKKAAREQGDPATIENAPPPPAAKPFQPVSVEKLRTDHDEFVGKRDPGQSLTDGDWPDIKAMLAKNPDRKKIAADYDVEFEEMSFFIESCQRREQRSGEALAPSHRGA